MEIPSKNKLEQDLAILKKGSFYFIKENDTDFIMEDRTKRGLTIKQRSHDEKLKVEADKGMIHDMDGIGHWVPIRWFFPKTDYSFNDVLVFAEKMDKKYNELRELTCPDDD